MWFELCCAIAFVFIVRIYYDSIRALILMWNVNGPPGIPLLGITFCFIGKNSPTELFKTFFDLTDKYGSYFKFWIASDLKVVIGDLNDVEIILSSFRYIEKSPDLDFFKTWLQDGLLMSGAEKWRNRRKVLEPAFHLKIIEKSIDVFDRLASTVVDQFVENGPNKSLEIFNIIQRYALDVICESAVGISVNALKYPKSEYVKSLDNVTSIAYHRMVNLALRNTFIFKFSKMYQQELRGSRVIHSFVDNAIITRRKELIDRMTHNENKELNENRVLLDLLLQTKINGEPLTDVAIREEINSIIFAGHHAISTEMTMSLYHIAKFPCVQKKCYDEMVSVFGTDKNSPPTIPLLNQLVYLDQVIKESMRLFAPAPIISRLATEDIELTNNRFVPKGSTVVIPFWTIFRNPEYFEDPLEFKPERFSDENVSDQKHSFAFTPFSAGPRSCIGQRHAMYEMKTIITKILRNFDISLESGCEKDPIFSANIALRPESPLKFYFKPRT